MMSKLSRLFAILVILTISKTGFSQDEESLKEFINRFYTDFISNESESLQSERFESFFVPQFQGTDVEVDLNGDVEVIDLDLGAIVEMYSRYRKVSGLDINFNITKFNTVAIKGATGVASFEVDFELAKNGATMSKGQQMVSLTAKRRGDSWQISFINRLYVQSQVYSGTCVCDVFTQGSDNFATFLTVPDGDSYLTSSDRFEIIGDAENRFVRVNGSDVYEWNTATNKVMVEETELGVARLPETAIKLILKNMNTEKCQSVTSQN